MRYLIFIILLFPSIANAQDYWVYIRLEDRVGLTVEQTAGRSKAGDIVQIVPITQQFSPTDKELKEYLIVKTADLTKKDIENLTKPKTELLKLDSLGIPQYKILAYRDQKLDVNNIGVPVKKGIVNIPILKDSLIINSTPKTQADLIVYKIETDLNSLINPIRLAWNYIDRKAFAATEVINTINKSGEDYNTLTLWEDATDNDLVSADEIRTAECYDDDGILDDNPTISGATTDATRYRKITVPSGERHDGKAGTNGFFIRTTTNASNIITVNEDNLIIEWIRWDNANTFGNNYGIYITGSNVTVRYTVGTISSTANQKSALVSAVIAGGNKIYRNLIYGNTIGYAFNSDNVGNTDLVYNNTSLNNLGIGFNFFNNGCLATYKNNLALSNTNDFVVNSGPTHTNNASSDSSGDSGLTGKTPTNEVTNMTTGSEDCHLKSTATVIDAGTNLGSPYDVDIDGQTVTGSWDIGADEYVAVSTTKTINFF